MIVTTLTVAVFNCGYTVPSVQKAHGQYHDIFADILQSAVSRHTANTKERVRLRVLGFDTIKDVYPDSLDKIDAIILSGSPSGVYEMTPWIKRLLAYINQLYKNHQSIKLYGSCFGHQIICEALFRSCGAVVRKDPAGWELGVHAMELSDSFVEAFGRCLGQARLEKTLRLQFLHGDHVVLAEDGRQLPPSISIVGTTPHCNVQGIYEAGRILTFQSHPEFDTFIETECVLSVGKCIGWDEEYTKAALTGAEAEDDSATASDIILAFLLGRDIV